MRGKKIIFHRRHERQGFLFLVLPSILCLGNASVLFSTSVAWLWGQLLKSAVSFSLLLRVPALTGIWVLLRGPRESRGQLTSYLYSSCRPQPVLPWWNGFECKIFQLIPLLANIRVIVSFRLRNFWLISNPPPYHFFLSSFLIFHIVLLSEFVFSFLWNAFSWYNENVSFSLLGFSFLEGHDLSLSWSHF